MEPSSDPFPSETQSHALAAHKPALSVWLCLRPFCVTKWIIYAEKRLAMVLKTGRSKIKG